MTQIETIAREVMPRLKMRSEDVGVVTDGRGLAGVARHVGDA